MTISAVTQSCVHHSKHTNLVACLQPAASRFFHGHPEVADGSEPRQLFTQGQAQCQCGSHRRPVVRSGSARCRGARRLTRQFAAGSSPARFIAQASFRSLPSARSQICRDSRGKIRACKGGRAAKWQVRHAPSSLALLARLEPSWDFRFSLIALGRRGEKASRAARLRPARWVQAAPANIGARRCLSPKTSAISPRCFAYRLGGCRRCLPISARGCAYRRGQQQ